MTTNRRIISVGGILLAAGSFAFAQQPILSTQEPAELGIAMRAKLGSSQKIVEGLTSGNFDMIRKGAVDLSGICESRIWRHRDDQVYSHYRGELQRSAIKIAEMADQQNLDGAAFTYMRALTTCISCHQYSRDVLRIAANPRSQGAVVSIPVVDEQQSSFQRRR